MRAVGGNRSTSLSMVFVGSMAAALAGCAGGSKVSDNPQFSSKSEPMSFESAGVDDIDIVRLIDPEGRGAYLPGESCDVNRDVEGAPRFSKQEVLMRRVECAFQAFKTYSLSHQEFLTGPKGGDAAYARFAGSPALAIRRNEIQDRMLLRSGALCRDFQRRLNINIEIQNDTNLTNFMRNSQERIVDQVSSLFPGGEVVSAITSGTGITDVPRYVQDEGQIEKVTARLAINGMGMARREIIAQIDQTRTAPVRRGGLPVGEQSGGLGVTPVTVYSLERAVADAMHYHSACSVNIGLQYAARLVANEAATPPETEKSFPPLLPGDEATVPHDTAPMVNSVTRLRAPESLTAAVR